MFSISFWIPLILILWIYVLWTRRRFYRLILKIPGPMGFPLIGTLYKYGVSGLLECGLENKRSGPIWLGWFGPIPILLVSEPVLTQEILGSTSAENKANLVYSVMKKFMGDGLVVLEDPLWSKHRKALNPSFGHNILLSFMPVFNTETATLLQELDMLIGNKEQDLQTLFQTFALRIATQTTMGSDVKNEDIYKDKSLMQSYNNIFDATTELALSPWLDNKLMQHVSAVQKQLRTEDRSVRKLIKKLIHRKLDADTTNAEQTSNHNNTFIKLAIDQFKKNVFSYQEVEDECHTIIFGAFETTANTIANTLMQLAMFPEYQERVFEEIQSVFPKSGDFEVTYEDIQKLEYLSLVITESMRLMPAIPLIGRRLSEDLKLSNGFELPKGLQVVINIYHTQRRKDIWGPQADLFNPENCTPTNMQNKHPYSFMPFSKGRRNCIGQKYALILLKLALSKILRNFKVSTSFRYEDLVIVNNPSLKYKEMPYLKFERRI